MEQNTSSLKYKYNKMHMHQNTEIKGEMYPRATQATQSRHC